MAEIDVTFLPRDTDVRKGYADAMRGNPPSKRTVPMTGNSMGKGMSNRGMTSGNAMALPKVTPIGDYMGLAFDASVRKGKDAARAYLLAKAKSDGRSETIIKSLLEQFDTSIGIQRSLKSDKGLGEGMEAIYRKNKGISYRDALEERNKESIKKMVKPVRKAVEAVGNAVDDSFIF